MKLAVIMCDPAKSVKASILKLFTGCTAYHVGWVDEERGKFYDMNLLRRRRAWPCYPSDRVRLFPAPPNLTREYLENMLDVDENVYGFTDYLLFGLRGLYHLIGKSTPNAKGIICSEMVNLDAWNAGSRTPWPILAPPPSPCDWLRWGQEHGDDLWG